MSIQLNPIGSAFTGEFNQSAAEVPAYDPASQRLFVVNSGRNAIDVIDLSDPMNPDRIESIVFLTGATPTSVAVDNGILAAAIADDVPTDRGNVVFLEAATSGFLNSVAVGALPESIAFTPDGSRLVVADEGEPSDSFDVDPEGTISIVDLSAGIENATVATADFEAFNALEEQLTLSGVRIFGPNATVAQDLEPESVAIAPDGQTAFVTLQENNAIARVDLIQAEVIDILPLGSQDFNVPNNGLDASDRDGGINIQPQPIRGLFQPDGIAAFEVNGETFYLTANEGDPRNTSGFNEEVRLQSLVLDPSNFPGFAALQQDENLGRLNVTNTLGDNDGDGDFEEIFTFGGRSFSILDASGNLVFNSGAQLEQQIAGLLPANFNSDNVDNNSFDSRSDDRGPEPEGLAIGVVGGATYAFIGLEQVGGIITYDVSDPFNPVFIDYVNNRDFSVPASLPDGSSNPAAGDLGPEGLLFISAEESPNNTPLLVVANEVSGSTTVFEIEDVDAIDDSSSVLYVAGSAEPGAADQLLIDRLIAQGFEVSVQDDNDIQASAAAGHDLVVISESVFSGNIGNTFTNINIPLVTWESFLYDDLDLTGNQANVDFGILDGQTQVSLASGQLRTVYNQLGKVSFGVPGAEAEVLATVANNPQQAAFFVYEANDQLSSGNLAVANRVGFFFNNFQQQALSATEVGLDLFDEAIARALGQDPGLTPPEPTTEILLVVSSLALNPRDAAIKELLEAREDLNVVVTVQDDDLVQSSDATGKDLVLISESVFSGNVGDTFTNVEVPLLTWEAFLYDDLGLTGGGVNQDFGALAGQTEIAPTGVGLTEGLGARTAVYSSPGQISFGVPTADAIISATVSEEDDRATIFAYETGAQLVGITAPARRVGFFLQDSTSEFDRITQQGLDLFNSAVDFALG